MYDPVETDISYEYLIKLKERAKRVRWAAMGGWGVFLQVKEEYKKAFAKEYLKSRDIDIFVDFKDEEIFLKVIKELGFKKSSYNFRYELIYNREKKRLVSEEEVKEDEIFNLIYIFLDVFSNKETKKLGSWVFPELGKAKKEEKEGIPVLSVDTLLELKMVSFFEREKLDKELKDACDIYALLFYTGKKTKVNLIVRKTAEKIISRYDLQEYIAEQVLGDSLKAGLVVYALRELVGER